MQNLSVASYCGFLCDGLTLNDLLDPEHVTEPSVNAIDRLKILPDLFYTTTSSHTLYDRHRSLFACGTCFCRVSLPFLALCIRSRVLWCVLLVAPPVRQQQPCTSFQLVPLFEHNSTPPAYRIINTHHAAPAPSTPSRLRIEIIRNI